MLASMLTLPAEIDDEDWEIDPTSNLRDDAFTSPGTLEDVRSS